MKTFDIYSLGEPPSFSIPEGCLMPNTERLSYELSMMLYTASTSGMSLSQGETTDSSALTTFMDNLSGNMTSWLDTNISEKMEGGEITPFTMPDFPVADIAMAVITGNVGLGVASIATWLVSSVATRYVGSLSKPSELDTSGIVEVLEKGLLDTEKANAIMYLLARTPIQVVVETLKDYVDTHLGPE